MDEHPGLIGRVVARLHHEIAADALESYRRAGVVVYRLQEELDQVRLDALVQP